MGRRGTAPESQRTVHSRVRRAVHIINGVADKNRILRTGIFPAQIFLHGLTIRLVYKGIIRTDNRIKIALQAKGKKVPSVFFRISGGYYPQSGTVFFELFQKLPDSGKNLDKFTVIRCKVSPEIHDFRYFFLRKAILP